jgi:hypothetical protein
MSRSCDRGSYRWTSRRWRLENALLRRTWLSFKNLGGREMGGSFGKLIPNHVRETQVGSLGMGRR